SSVAWRHADPAASPAWGPPRPSLHFLVIVPLPSSDRDSHRRVHQQKGLPLAFQAKVRVPTSHLQGGVAEAVLDKDRVHASRLGSAGTQVTQVVDAGELGAAYLAGHL